MEVQLSDEVYQFHDGPFTAYQKCVWEISNHLRQHRICGECNLWKLFSFIENTSIQRIENVFKKWPTISSVTLSFREFFWRSWIWNDWRYKIWKKLMNGVMQIRYRSGIFESIIFCESIQKNEHGLGRKGSTAFKICQIRRLSNYLIPVFGVQNLHHVRFEKTVIDD
jgi:hypothetical protein